MNLNQDTTLETDDAKTLREMVQDLESLVESDLKLSTTDSYQVINPLHKDYKFDKIQKELTSITSLLKDLIQFKFPSAAFLNKLEKISRTRAEVRNSRKQFQHLTNQLMEASLLFRCSEVTSSKLEKLLAQLELCSLHSGCDFFVGKGSSSFEESMELESSNSVADLVTISTTSFLLDISVHPESGIEKVTCRFFNQEGEEFMGTVLCQRIESWLSSGLFSLLEKKLQKVWNLDKIDKSIENVDVVKQLHNLRSILSVVYQIESEKSVQDCLVPIEQGHGCSLSDLEGVSTLFYLCWQHREELRDDASKTKNGLSVFHICEECYHCKMGTVSVREEFAAKELFLPLDIMNNLDVSQEQIPIALEKLIGAPIIAGLSYVFYLRQSIKMNSITEKTLRFCDDEQQLEAESNRFLTKSNYRRDIAEVMSLNQLILEEVLIQDCGWTQGIEENIGKEVNNNSVAFGLQYKDDWLISGSYSFAVHRQTFQQCVQVDCIPFCRLDSFIRILGVLRQQLLFNELFQSLFCHTSINGNLYSIRTSLDKSDWLVTCIRGFSPKDNCQLHFEVSSFPPYRIQLNLFGLQGRMSAETITVRISIATHGRLNVLLSHHLEETKWMEELLRTTRNIPLLLFVWLEKRNGE
eukprot:jgi/Galph1/782/GphlegSOOS_G5507.1